MAKSKDVEAANIEFHSDAMERFERAAKIVAKSAPQHRVAKTVGAKKIAAKKQTPPKRG